MSYFCFADQLKANNHPIGEKSPNLVTLGKSFIA
jgi:hypothetical protein